MVLGQVIYHTNFTTESNTMVFWDSDIPWIETYTMVTIYYHCKSGTMFYHSNSGMVFLSW